MPQNNRPVALVAAALLLVAGLAGAADAAKPGGKGKPTRTLESTSPSPESVAPTTEPAPVVVPEDTSVTATAPDTTSSTTTTVTSPSPAPTATYVAPTASALDQAAANRLSRLPQRVALGVKAFPNEYGTRGWMQDSGVQWDYAYQYLIGLGTTENWSTWLGGRYVVDYAQSAAALKAVPSFSYFQINKAAGPCGTCTNIERNLTNLASPATAGAWFNDYRTLLKRLSAGTYDGIKGYGYGAIVHVEPDLSAYVQQALIHPTKCPGTCTPGGTGPEHVRAAVASTGDPDLAGFADTYAGFNQAVLALRDKYAPNVSLGYHVSNWAGQYDVNLNRNAIDTDAIADSIVAFARANGAAKLPGQRRYDLIYNDILDRDSGAYDTQFNKSDTWWDADNIRAPHFHRWQKFLGRITSQLQLPAFVWQVPVGNQETLTMDNSYGHTQDNKVAYLTSHMAELQAIGVWAVLIGSGNPGSTVQWDGQKDGVTNAPVNELCSSAGVYNRVLCWTAKSTVTDDDGGFLRRAGAAYYAQGALAPKRW